MKYGICEVALYIDVRAFKFFELGTDEPRLVIADVVSGEVIEIFAPNDTQRIEAVTIRGEVNRITLE